jgi:nitrite reductase/ring-hydroxylating ferredoxin subunit
MLKDQSRRDFCVHACQFGSLLAIGALTGCGKNPAGPSTNAPPLPTVASSVNGRVVSINIDAASPLANVGSAATTNTSIGTFLIARTGTDTFVALTAICTHEGCTVSQFENGNYVCPCHGSRYSTSGQVTNGPATRSLSQFGTAFANNVLTFTA